MCLKDTDTIPTAGRVQNSGGDHPCGTGSMGWDYGNPTNSTGTLWGSDRWYWFGNVPFGGTLGTRLLYLSCNAGSFTVDYTDSANDPIPSVTPTWSGTGCPMPSGTVDIGGVLSSEGACDDGSGFVDIG